MPRCSLVGQQERVVVAAADPSRFRMPIPGVGRNPAMDEAEAATWRWIDAFALAPSPQVRQRLQHGRPALGVALGFPRAPASALTLFSQYMAFLLIVDDEFDDGPAGLDMGHCQAAIGALVRVFDRGTASGPPARRAESHAPGRTTMSAQFEPDPRNADR